jgi:hypothetical protein
MKYWHATPPSTPLDYVNRSIRPAWLMMPSMRRDTRNATWSVSSAEPRLVSAQKLSRTYSE